MLRLLFSFSLAASLLAADHLLVPIDPQQYQQFSETIAQAAQDGNYAAVLRDGRRALELTPNNPEAQAPIYVFMSIAARGLGESARAEDYASIARTLDPQLESRLGDSAANGITRGDAAGTVNTIGAAVTVFGQIFSSIQQMRLMKLCLDMVKHRMTPPPQCGPQGTGMPSQGVMQQPMPVGMGFPSPAPSFPQTASPYQTGANVSYPSAAVGTSAYQAPATPPTPMPGWPAASPPQSVAAPTPAAAPLVAAPPPIAAPAPVVPPTPVAAQVQAPVVPAATPETTAGAAMQPPATPQAATPPDPQSNVSQVRMNFYLSGTGFAYRGPSDPAPYSAAPTKITQELLRGSAEQLVFKVIHDHSNLNSQTYFEESCGGLLSVNGTNVTFTGTGGEAPLVIPAADIIDIRVNSLIGRDAGVFHIATRRGLYLALAPESQDREKARALIETLRSRLGIPE